MLRFPKGANHPLRLLYKNILRLAKPSKSSSTSHIKIDVLIPVVEKDLPALSFVITCARKNILHPIGNIYVAGRKGLIEDFCKQAHCIFLDEDRILPIKKSDILQDGKEWFRSGWLFQQLIKLSADVLAANEHVLVLDADTCITSKQSFVVGADFILNFADEYHFPYSNYNKLNGLDKRFYLSFICHHMLFNRQVLKELKQAIQTHTGKDWIQAIITETDFNISSCFSEYETYGNFLYYKHRNKVQLEYWQNKSLDISLLNNKTIEQYQGKFKSVSFHKYPY